MSLCGCQGDEVKGLPGVGEATALNLVRNARDLKSIMVSIKEGSIKANKKTIKALEEDEKKGFKTIKRTRRLVRLYGLDPMLEKELMIKKLEDTDLHSERLFAALEVLKFNSLLGAKEKDLLKGIMNNQK